MIGASVLDNASRIYMKLTDEENYARNTKEAVTYPWTRVAIEGHRKFKIYNNDRRQVVVVKYASVIAAWQESAVLYSPIKIFTDAAAAEKLSSSFVGDWM
eukprot:GHVU01224168.1.p1 GENE.GHVU01224168.1~~GHVU01224168.1.p1  ORF type:complete len:100 (-),score=14.64 GHVU01224168.1:149-448(-)